MAKKSETLKLTGGPWRELLPRRVWPIAALTMVLSIFSLSLEGTAQDLILLVVAFFWTIFTRREKMKFEAGLLIGSFFLVAAFLVEPFSFKLAKGLAVPAFIFLALAVFLKLWQLRSTES